MRAFIAVEISDAVKDMIEGIKGELAHGGIRPVERENLHLTLHFLGEIDEGKKNVVIEAMDKISVRKFEMECRGVGAFPNPNFIKVIWVGASADGLRELHGQTGDALKQIGFKVEEYSPHITIARVKTAGEKERIAGFLKSHNEEGFGSCAVEKVVLKKSTLTPKGPIYENVHEVSLS